MIPLKKATMFAALTTLFASSPLLANETYVCKHGNQERTIKVVYANADSSVPCAVTYDKGTGTESLWQAQNSPGYCSEKAAEFVEKQRVWGWDCNKQ
ncbi:MAG: hypothetical protein R8M11_05120 [Gallionella sp.]